MAKVCRPGGLVINSMTLEYTKVNANKTDQELMMTPQIVKEYQGIDDYVAELQEEGVWTILSRKVISDYINGKDGLIHILRVN